MKALILVLGLTIVLVGRLSGAGDAPTENAIYDPDPGHLWNRLFAGFYRQNISNNHFYPNEVGYDGNRTEPRWIGPDVLDPPLGYHPRYLLEDESFAKANALLVEFAGGPVAGPIRDPLKRALMQRDLWAVFDVLAQADQAATFPMGSGEYRGGWRTTASQEQHRALLENRLARAIRSLALTREEIENLPDTWDAAIASGAFSEVLQSNRYDFLPRELFAANSGWFEVSPGPSPGKQVPQVLEHSLLVGGRSVFRTFVKPPADYGMAGPMAGGNPYPDGTQFLLLREMMVLDADCRMVPTHVVESFQYRTERLEDGRAHAFAREAELSRSLLFQGQQGGLRPVVKGDLRVRLYDGLGHLRVDEKGNAGPLMPFPQNCAACHPAALLLVSRAASFSKPARSVSIEAGARWKEDHGKLDQLRKLTLPASTTGR